MLQQFLAFMHNINANIIDALVDVIDFALKKSLFQAYSDGAAEMYTILYLTVSLAIGYATENTSSLRQVSTYVIQIKIGIIHNLFMSHFHECDIVTILISCSIHILKEMKWICLKFNSIFFETFLIQG